MEIIKINPQGYCKGVIEAINIIKNTNPSSTYILGQIIHNKSINETLEKMGFRIVEGKSRLDMLDSINEGTVVFTAHGVSPKVYEKAKSKGLKIIDATCKKVIDVHKKIQSKIKDMDIIYIGKRNHPETEGVLGIDDKIILFDDIKNPPILDKNKKYFVTNQTTLSLYKIEEFYDYLKNYNVEIDNSICMATTIRQKAVLNAPDCDLFIVVGDYFSSNTNELYNIAKRKFNSIKIETLHDLDISILKDVFKICITSGASTPKKIVDQVIDYLKDFDYNSPRPFPNKIEDLVWGKKWKKLLTI